MGCGTSSPVFVPRVGFSLTNKPIKETHSLQSRTVISSKGSVNIDLVREFVLINHLNKEILFRLKEDSNIPKNSESEFIDLRNINQFNKSRLLLFLNVDAERDKPFGDTSDSLLKTLFDFKHLFLLADASDESVLVSAKSLLLSEDASMIGNNTTNINPAAMTADSFRIPAKARTFIKHITSKGVKPKTFSIITTSYATIEQNFPNYIILNGQPKISMASIVEENNQKNKNGNQVQGASEDNELPRDYKLLGDNAILAKTIFPRIQLPLFLYDHSDFLASNSETISNPKKSKPPLIFVQSLPTLLSNLNSQEGVKYFLETLGIKSILCACNEKCDFPQFKGLLPIIQIPLTNKEMKIKMMNQIFSNVQTGVSTLLVRSNNREAFLEIISVFKALLYERFQVFTSQIQEYLTHAIPKNIAYSAVNTQSMIAKDGDNKDNGKSQQQQQQINNDIFVNIPGNNKVEKEILSRVDELKEVAVKIFKENKKNKAKSDEIMDVFSQIFENIVRNPNEPKYKQLKKDNKKLKETVFSTKHSDGLLKLIGFMENGEMYVNNLPATDIALIKGDLELAFKQAVVEVYQ